jgi:threonine dehydratase
VELPTFEDVLRARAVIREHLPRTPAFEYPALSAKLGCTLFVKHENHQPVGAFKVRGGVNLVAGLAPDERARGVLAATRGNHGLAVAFAARRFGVRAVIGVPHGNNPEKNEAMRALGAELVVHGRDFDDAREHADELARRHGYRYVHSANEPALVAGAATAALELFEDVPDLDALFVPVGLGSGICGAGIVRAARSPRTRLVGVQSERAPSIYLSWRERRPVTTPSADTFADGLATRVPQELTLGGILRFVDDFALVSEAAIAQAIRDLLRYTHNLAEGAGAAPLAAVESLREKLAGQRVAIVLSGGNLDGETLRRVLASPAEGAH